MRGAAYTIRPLISGLTISTHAPHARRGKKRFSICSGDRISTHAPHARRGTADMLRRARQPDFYSRASCEARHFGVALFASLKTISTHAPHARRGFDQISLEPAEKFLLTRLMRGAARSTRDGKPIIRFLLTRLMRGAAYCLIYFPPNITISTHAPHARRGFVRLLFSTQAAAFLLTRLMRGAAKKPRYDELKPDISTHAPHARRGINTNLNTSSKGAFLLTRLMRGAACATIINGATH